MKITKFFSAVRHNMIYFDNFKAKTSKKNDTFIPNFLTGTICGGPKRTALLSEFLLLRLHNCNCDLSYIASILFANANFTHVRT